ncbi:MAG: hypothetical protein ACEY3B_03060 [Wolbachia sp.]
MSSQYAPSVSFQCSFLVIPVPISLSSQRLYDVIPVPRLLGSRFFRAITG